MRRVCGWFLAVAVAGLVFSVDASAQTAMVQIGQAPVQPLNERVLGALAASTTIPVTVQLAPTDPAALANYATEVSTPGTPGFRHYLSVAGFRSRFAPTDSQIAAVRSALSADGLSPSPVSANGLEITLSATAAQLSTAFSTSFQQVAVAGGRSAYVNTSAPAVPSAIASTIQSVIGLDDLTVPQAMDQPSPTSDRAAGGRAAAAGHPDAVSPAAAAQPHVVTGGPQPCAGATADATTQHALTADQLASAYDFSGLYQQGDLGAGITVGLYEAQPYEASDIAMYQACYGTDATVSTVEVGSGIGTGAGNEATGDIEDIMGLAPQVSVIVYEGAPADTADEVVAITNEMVSDNRADVLSSSWGYTCGTAPANVAQAEQIDFEEAAIQGQSFVTASGDDGSEGCTTADFTVGGTPQVEDPSGEPFITSVGGTQINALGPPPTETTWNEGDLGSSGGVSDVATMPAYQLDASPSLHVINSYSSGTPCGAPSGEYCLETPDVSADASGDSGYTFYFGGSWQAQRGTSFSAPLWAALIALTDASPECGPTDVGFLNPLLYRLAGSSSYATDFNDITTGNSDVNGKDGGLYPAGVGFDLATGLGTPIGTPLAHDLCAAKNAGVTVTNPGAQHGTAGTSVSLPVNATDVNNSALEYSATGLPAGLTIDPTSGVITGTPTASGVSTVTVVVTDSDGVTGQAVFGWNLAARSSAITTTVDDASTKARWSGTERAGAAAYATATLTTSGPTPTGTVTYERFGNASCSGPAVTEQTVTLTASGAVPASAASVALIAASYSYLVDYSGDGVYTSATACAAFTVAPAASTVSPPVTCPAATGGVTGTSLGGVRLGMSSAQIQKAHHHNYKANGPNGGTLCLEPAGIILFYAPPKLLASMKASARKPYKGRLVFAYTANAHYAVSGIHVGSKLAAAQKALHVGKELTVDGTTWYVVLHGSVAVLLSVKHGSITRLGIATRALNQTRAQQLRFLRDID
jgi:Pro-kumamolisin, activation domain/Putative Ig domain